MGSSEAAAIIQVSDGNHSDQGENSGSGVKQPNTGYILKVEPVEVQMIR